MLPIALVLGMYYIEVLIFVLNQLESCIPIFKTNNLLQLCLVFFTPVSVIQFPKSKEKKIDNT